MSVVIETTVGDITVDLYTKERPNTCLNFLKLCKIKYYNFCIFFKIEKNFIAQAGDPTATGRAGESVFCHLYGDQAKYFDSEFKPRLKHEKIGTLSMVNNGNNMNGSQFFLTLSENLVYLDENHTVFGEVTEGFDVLLKLNDAICDNNNRPFQDIRITHTVVLHDPYEDPKGLEIPDASPEPTREMLESNYIGADEEIDDNKGKSAQEVEEKIKESEAKARATILEMVGDIPDAEVKPPENVLFVCKLNPVTTSEDLEVIFSRFGQILSCEVIKDKKTGESLQYAFIEFEREEDCEAAYFKMDNVLIDDRRIHVDFSQSVSKLYFNRGKLPNTKEFQSNLSIKKTDRNDGYDLIFDMENDTPANDKRQKSKSNNSGIKPKSSSRKDKSEEKRSSREEGSYSDRKYDSNKSYKYNSEKESQRHREYDYSHSSNKRENDRSDRYKKEYPSHSDRSREEKRYDKYRDIDNSYSSDRNRDLLNSKSYRDPGNYRKPLPESHSKEPKTSTKRNRNDSVSPDRKKSHKSRDQSDDNRNKKKYSDRSGSGSPDRKKSHKSRDQSHDNSNRKKYSIRPDSVSPDQRKSHKYREQSYDNPNKKKYFNRSDSDENVAKSKKSKSENKDSVKKRVKSSSQKLKDPKSEKSSSLKKQKSKKSRSFSVSSTSSSSSSSSTSSSSSDSNSSSNSSRYKYKKRHHQKKKELPYSEKKSKLHKKKKYKS